MDKGTRGELLDRLTGAIESASTSHPLRVAVDGPPAAGKTTLANELALLLRARGREVIRATTESFHLPRAQRYRRGEFSPEANYHDSFDYDTLRRVLLDPLGPDGDRRYQHAVYDIDTDTALSPPVTTAPADAVLLLDGVFLLRPELIDRWDLSIFVSAPFEQMWIAPASGTWPYSDPPPKSSGVSAPATSPPRSSTSPPPARPITPTSSCATTSPGAPRGKSDRTDQHGDERSKQSKESTRVCFQTEGRERVEQLTLLIVEVGLHDRAEPVQVTRQLVGRGRRRQRTVELGEQPGDHLVVLYELGDRWRQSRMTR